LTSADELLRENGRKGLGRGGGKGERRKGRKTYDFHSSSTPVENPDHNPVPTYGTACTTTGEFLPYTCRKDGRAKGKEEKLSQSTRREELRKEGRETREKDAPSSTTPTPCIVKKRGKGQVTP